MTEGDGGADADDRDRRLPAWAIRSRRVFGIACVGFGLIGLIGLLARLVSAVAGIALDVGEVPAWVPAAFWAVPAVIVASGLVWLVGMAVAGYREVGDGGD